MTTVYNHKSSYASNFDGPVRPVTGTHWEDAEGNPSGGSADGPGYSFPWQQGVVTSPEAINGACVIDVLRSTLQRLEFFNAGKFRCRENSLAITHIEEAIHWCEHRINDRINRGVMSTMEP